MSAESNRDELLTPKGACQQFREPVPLKTLYRWIHDGVLNRRTGERVYIAHEFIGGQIRIERTSVSNFIAALNRGHTVGATQ